jgi:hypothetical protein
MLGTDEGANGASAPFRSPFPRAGFINQRVEVDTFRDPHPMQWAWYVPDGMKGARLDNLVEIDGSVELGVGIAIIHTPGHTDGNQSLLLNTDTGAWISSENGVCADSWQPELSKIPGLRKTAEFFGREVILNSNTLEDSIDQYDSMVLEKALADPNTRDSRWLNVFPSSEMDDRKLNWPVRPTFTHGEIAAGAIVKPQSRVAA